MTRIHVHCSKCRHPGKARSSSELGVCSRCGAPRVIGVPAELQRKTGRPRLTVADRLRQLADDVEREEVEAKRERLRAAGWMDGDARDLLGLSDAEVEAAKARKP